MDTGEASGERTGRMRGLLPEVVDSPAVGDEVGAEDGEVEVSEEPRVVSRSRLRSEGRRTVRVCATGSDEAVRRTSFQPWEVFYDTLVSIGHMVKKDGQCR